MFPNSVFMLNYPLELTLIQSSMKALKGGVMEGFNTHTHTQTQKATHSYQHTTKGGCSLEIQQLRNQFVKGSPALLFKDRPSNRFSLYVCLYFRQEKKECAPVHGGDSRWNRSRKIENAPTASDLLSTLNPVPLLFSKTSYPLGLFLGVYYLF